MLKGTSKINTGCGLYGFSEFYFCTDYLTSKRDSQKSVQTGRQIYFFKI
jgi:hypothetical protein